LVERKAGHDLSESSVRKLAHKHGYSISISRQREHLINRGEFMLTENSMNAVVMGPDTMPTSAKFATISV
jgi:hypothetical protein